MSFGGYERSTMRSYDKVPEETVEQVEKYPIADMSCVGIPDFAAERYGVRMSVSEVDGETPTAFYYPYYGHSGKLEGYKKENLQIPKGKRGHYQAIGTVGVRSMLFGQDVAEELERPKKTLFAVEGEKDTLATYAAFVEGLRGTKWEGLEPHIVSLSCGTVNAAEAFMANIDFVSKFPKKVLGFDNDAATESERRKGVMRGQEATEAVAAALMSDDIFTVRFPDDYKDPHEMYQDGKGDQLQKLFQFESQKFVAEKIVTVSGLDFESLIAAKPEGDYVEAFPKLMEKIHGFRKRELTVVTGPSGFGKTSVSSEIAYSLAEKGNRVGMIFLEEESQETVKRMMARYLHISHNRMKQSPLSCATKEELKKAYKWCSDEDRFVLLDHFGSIRIQELMNKLRAFVYMNKVDYVILDHLSMTVSGLAEHDERKLLDITMTELAAFCASTDVGVIAVSHLNRNVAQEFKPPKGNEGQPFFVTVRKEDLRGSAALEQLSWIVIGVEPCIMPDKSRGPIRLTCLKNRPWGFLGNCDVLATDDDTGIFGPRDINQF